MLAKYDLGQQYTFIRKLAFYVNINGQSFEDVKLPTYEEASKLAASVNSLLFGI